MRTLLIGLLLASVSCTNRFPQPADLDASDICVQCKMAISERRYAAELADADGNILKFDNVDCVARYALRHGLTARDTTGWVMNADGKQWLDLRRAVLVKSEQIPGPMGSGVLAAPDRAAAEALIRRSGGRIIGLEDLCQRPEGEERP